VVRVTDPTAAFSAFYTGAATFPSSSSIVLTRLRRSTSFYITYTRCGKLTSFFELSGLKRRGAPGGWAWSRSREGILKLCDFVVQ
jgi:hypothetical protein